ncbi:hypothetical protein L917_14591, partial [Phytophthora nicotianae]
MGAARYDSEPENSPETVLSPAWFTSGFQVHHRGCATFKFMSSYSDLSGYLGSKGARLDTERRIVPSGVIVADCSFAARSFCSALVVARRKAATTTKKQVKRMMWSFN